MLTKDKIPVGFSAKQWRSWQRTASFRELENILNIAMGGWGPKSITMSHPSDQLRFLMWCRICHQRRVRISPNQLESQLQGYGIQESTSIRLTVTYKIIRQALLIDLSPWEQKASRPNYAIYPFAT